MERIILIGAEDVANAGHRIASAAETMNRAVSNLDDTLRRNQQFMDEWLGKFEQILADYKGAS